MLYSAVKSPPRSSSAWWATRPSSWPGKKNSSTLATCSWTRPAWWWTGTYYRHSSMYPSDWSNDLTCSQFMYGSMLLSWDLMPNDSNSVAYLSPRHLGTVKVNLRFAKPLPATTTFIAYAQYDNLVLIDGYHTAIFEYNAWRTADSFRRPWWGILGRTGLWLASTPGTNAGPCPLDFRQATSSTWPGVELGTLGGSLPQRLEAGWVLQFLWHCAVGVHIPTLTGDELRYQDICYTMKML